MSRAVIRGTWQQNKGQDTCSQVSEMLRVQTMEESSPVIRCLEKKHSSKECCRGAAVALDGGSVTLRQNTRLLRTQRRASEAKAENPASSTVARFTRVGTSGEF